MDTMNVMMNGIPGDMAATIARHLIADDRFHLIPHSLTGPEVTETECTIDGVAFQLIRPDEKEDAIGEIVDATGAFITVDFTHPSAVNENGAFYCRHGLPFVMGTTGGNRQQLADAVASAGIPAVIAPNMAKQIVGFQALMDYGAATFPDLFRGYTLEIRESHQKGKADTSGTAKAMVTYFNAMGVPYAEEDIRKERDAAAQKDIWGIPEAYLKGHAWHTYSLDSDDETAHFEFTHNINGRDIYARGTLDAIVYLQEKVAAGVTGRAFTMIDLLKGV